MIPPRNGALRLVQDIYQGVAGGLSDEALLERYLEREGPASESAFHALVERLGPRVWRICLRVTGNHHDAEEAFQASFVALARKARAIRRRPALSGWMARVATRTAIAVRDESRRRERRRVLAIDPDSLLVDDKARGTSTVHAELEAALFEELDRLPTAFRTVVALHDLDGLTYDQIADRLRCRVGTVKSRLARARRRLRERLRARGLGSAPGIGLLGLSLTVPLTGRAALSSGLVTAVVRAAVPLAPTSSPLVAGGVSGALIIPLTFTEKAMTTMSLSKVTMVLATMVTTGAVAVGTATYQVRETAPATPSDAPTSNAELAAEIERLRSLVAELQGDAQATTANPQPTQEAATPSRATASTASSSIGVAGHSTEANAPAASSPTIGVGQYAPAGRGSGNQAPFYEEGVAATPGETKPLPAPVLEERPAQQPILADSDGPFEIDPRTPTIRNEPNPPSQRAPAQVPTIQRPTTTTMYRVTRAVESPDPDGDLNRLKNSIQGYIERTMEVRKSLQDRRKSLQGELQSLDATLAKIEQNLNRFQMMLETLNADVPRLVPGTALSVPDVNFDSFNESTFSDSAESLIPASR